MTTHSLAIRTFGCVGFGFVLTMQTNKGTRRFCSVDGMIFVFVFVFVFLKGGSKVSLSACSYYGNIYNTTRFNIIFRYGAIIILITERMYNTTSS